MKQKKIIFIAILTLCFLPAISYSAGPCDSASQLVIDPEFGTVDEQLQNYFTSPPVNEGAYCLKFNSDEALIVSQLLSVTNNDSSKDMYISGLNIEKKGVFDSGSTPILTITAASAKNIYVSNLMMNGIVHGLKIAKTSTGSISVADSTITGDSSASSTGITVNAAGAVLNGVTLTGVVNGINVQSGSSGASITSANITGIGSGTGVSVAAVGTVMNGITITNVINGIDVAATATSSSITSADVTCSAKTGSGIIASASGATITGGTFTNCAKGIEVGADGVRITGSNVHDNKYGVYVDAGITGTDVS